MATKKKVKEGELRKKLIEWDKENPRQLAGIAKDLNVLPQYLSSFKAGGPLAEKYFAPLEKFLNESQTIPQVPPNHGTPAWLMARELRDCADWLELPNVDPAIKSEKLKALISRYAAGFEAFERLIKESK